VKRSDYMKSVRANAALTAYSTALDWFRRLPAAEVERRLTAMVAQKEKEFRDANQAQFANDKPSI
jgi:uncharacterized membrane protein YccC